MSFTNVGDRISNVCVNQIQRGRHVLVGENNFNKHILAFSKEKPGIFRGEQIKCNALFTLFSVISKLHSNSAHILHCTEINNCSQSR